MNKPTILVDLGGHFGQAVGAVALDTLNPHRADKIRRWLDAAGFFSDDAEDADAASPSFARLIARLSDIGTCGECGEDVTLVHTGPHSLGVESACAHPGGLGPFDVEIDVPSGRLVFANDLRDLVTLNTLDDDHYVNHACEIVRCSRDYAEVGLIHLYVGNTCPGIFRLADGSVTVLSPHWDAEATAPPEPLDRERLGSICTDLWWFGAMDAEAFAAACAERGLDATAMAEVVVEVEPGRWRFTGFYHMGRHADSTGDTVMATARRLGPCHGQAPAPEAVSSGNALHDSRFWQSWRLSQAKYPELFPTLTHWLEHLFCVLGSGHEWNGGELRSRERDQPFAASLDDPCIRPLRGTGLLDRVPTLPVGALERFGRCDWSGQTERRRQVYPMSAEYVTAGTMPLGVDRFHLAAALMLFHSLACDHDALNDASDQLRGAKHDGSAWAAGEREATIAKARAGQVRIVDRCLDLMLTLAEERGLWADGSLAEAFSLLLQEDAAFGGTAAT